MPNSLVCNACQPMRCLTYLKKEIPDKVEPVFASFFEAMWLEHLDVSKPEELTTALLRVFDRDSVEKLIHAANLPETKQRLNQVTTYVHQELGAFGCPWFTVHNGEGKAEPFFGSDRFHYMWDFLDLPHQDLELKDPNVPKL
jgi:glutathione S-transferase kappa 1